MSEDTILVEKKNHVGLITLNNPKALNSLNLHMIHGMKKALDQWRDDPDVRVVLMDSIGDKAFCAGGDVVSLYRSMVENNEHAAQFFQFEYDLDLLIHQYTKPIVCLADKIVMGGGIGIMNGCSHRVVTERTMMAMPEITIGLFPDVGGSYFLNKMPDRTGLFLGLTGSRFNGSDALYLNMADHFVESSKLDVLREELIDYSWKEENGENKIRLTDLLAELQSLSKDVMPESNVKKNHSEINRLMDFDNLHVLFKQLRKYKTDDNWMGKAIKSLLGGSPTSAAVIWEQYKRGKDKSIEQAFSTELTMAKNFVEGHDFQEGVRALLIDKDGKPEWSPAKIEDVFFEDVEKFFTP